MNFEYEMPENIDREAIIIVNSAWRSYISASPEARLGDEAQYECAIITALRDLGYSAVKAEEISTFSRLSAQLDLMPSELD